MRIPFRRKKDSKTSRAGGQPHETVRATPRIDAESVQSESVTAPSFPDGVKVLHDCQDAVVDVCLVHGLTGDRESTWTAEGQLEPWPKSLLPSRLDKARILTYGYDAYGVRKGLGGSALLIDRARNLLQDLTAERADGDLASRPIIFIAHNMGGLVCKKALLLSRSRPEDKIHDIFNHTEGIVFVGTPHGGSWMADWAKIPISAMGPVKTTNVSLLDILQNDNQHLESTQLDFLEMIRDLRMHAKKLEITCVYEELPLPMIGKVVAKDSAILDGYNILSIHDNHINMVKFTSTEETGFKQLLAELSRWKSEIIKATAHFLKDCQACLKSLAFPQMRDRSFDIHDATEGTCDWLLQHKTYKSWAGSNRGLLWIKGKPGSGKSTLLKYALDKNQQSVPRPGNHELVLSFFFHGRGNELQHHPLGFFRSLLHQILGQMPSALTALIREFNRKTNEIGIVGEKWQWHEEELRRYCELAISNILRLRPACLFVDALDECGKDNAVKLFQWFKSFLRKLPSTSSQFHVCISCRHYPILDQDCDFDICPERENHADISTYVQAQLSSSKELAMSSIPKMITDRASGIFMWAYLVVRQVLSLDAGGAPLHKIKKAVETIPPELDDLYKNLVQEMDELPASLKLIEWICFATRPLTLDELRWAIVIEANKSHRSLREYENEEDYVENAERMKRRLQTLSCGLAEANESSDAPDRSDMARDNTYHSIIANVSSSVTLVVQFIHQSVKDFFMEKGLLAMDRGLTPVDVSLTAHARLLKICLRYLAFEDIDQILNGYKDKQAAWKHRTVIMAEFPLLYYSTTSWIRHLQQSDTDNGHNDLLALFAWPSNTLIDRWVRLYNILLPDRYDYLPHQTNLIHVASQYHIPKLLAAILQRTKQATRLMNAKDNWGRTPLSLAAERGHEAVIKVLLDTGKVEIDSKDDLDGRTPLSVAAQAGHEAVVKLLLNTGWVDIDSEADNGQTPLIRAVRQGHEAIVKLLLDTEQVNINSQDRVGQTPLSFAAERGDEAVVRLLLDTGKARVDATDHTGMTPLALATTNKHVEVVKLLQSAKQQHASDTLLYAAPDRERAIYVDRHEP